MVEEKQNHKNTKLFHVHSDESKRTKHLVATCNFTHRNKQPVFRKRVLNYVVMEFTCYDDSLSAVFRCQPTKSRDAISIALGHYCFRCLRKAPTAWNAAKYHPCNLHTARRTTELIIFNLLTAIVWLREIIIMSISVIVGQIITILHHHPLSWLCFGFSTYSTLNRCSTHPCVHDGDGLFLNVDEIHKNKWIRYEDVFRRIDDQNVKIIIIIAWAKRFGCWTVMSRHDVCIRNQLYQVHWTLIFNFVVSPRSHSIRFDSCWQFEFLSRFFSFSIRENEVCMLFTVSWLNV